MFSAHWMYRMSEKTSTEVVFRSDNLVISRRPGAARLNFELRFPTCHARGHAESRCPRCASSPVPSHWELEGPDGAHNVCWMKCPRTGTCAQEQTWVTRVEFSDGWVELE